MILIGMRYERLDCTGRRTEGTYLEEAADIHAAAATVLKSSWGTPWQMKDVVGGEFHDTATHKTWSVDRHGHTKHDYRDETEQAFRKRWEELKGP